MKCSEVLPLLELLSDSELDSKDSALVLEHLNGCSECQNEWRQVEQLRSIFKSARETTPVPVTLIEKIDKRVLAEEKVQRQSFKIGIFSFKGYLSLAATLLILGLVVFFAVSNQQLNQSNHLTLTATSLIENSSTTNQVEPVSDLNQLGERIGYPLKYVHLPGWKMQGAGLVKTDSAVGIARFSFVKKTDSGDQKLCCYQGPEGSIRCDKQNCKQEKLSEKLVAFGNQGPLSFALWSQNGRDYLFISEMPQTELKKIVEGA